MDNRSSQQRLDQQFYVLILNFKIPCLIFNYFLYKISQQLSLGVRSPCNIKYMYDMLQKFNFQKFPIYLAYFQHLFVVYINRERNFEN